jgi:hypothetical protein
MVRMGITAGPAERDLFPLRQRQTPALEASAPTRSDPARRSQPTAALFAIAAGRDRGIVDELPSSHARPEHLIDLRNHPITEPHTTPPTRDVAITARTRGTACGTTAVIPWGCLISDRMHGSVVEGHHRRGGRIIRSYAVGRPLTGGLDARPLTTTRSHHRMQPGRAEKYVRCAESRCRFPASRSHRRSGVGRRTQIDRPSIGRWRPLTGERHMFHVVAFKASCSPTSSDR